MSTERCVFPRCEERGACAGHTYERPAPHRGTTETAPFHAGRYYEEEHIVLTMNEGWAEIREWDPARSAVAR